MNVFDASSFSERMGNGRSSLCRVGEPINQLTRSNHPAKCRKEKGGIILKAKTKLTKLWAILLSLVMLLSLLPTTAFAASPDADVALYNNAGKLISLSNKQYLATNGDTEASTGYNGTQGYVARYEASTGTLFLKGYHGVGKDGGIVTVGDLNIVVESDSSFTTSITSSTNTLMGIQSGKGKLNISGTGKLTVTVGKNNVTENGPVYGIHAQSGAISLSGNDMTVTATGGTEFACGVYNDAKTSSTAADNGNIDISGKLTVNLSNGKYNRGISSKSGVITLDGATVKIPGSYYCGIYNANGNVVIKSNSDVDISSDISNNRGIWTENGGSLTIDKSIVKVSSNGIVAEIYENASIKDSTVDLTLTDNHYEVIRADSTAANTIDLSGSGSVTLTATGKQDYAMFGGKVTLGTNTKCEKGTAISSWNNYAGEYDAISNTTVLKFVHESAAPATYTVSFDANGGTGTMADVTGISGEYTLPANGFTAPAGKQFKAWSVGGVEKAAGDKITVTANTTVTAVWEAIEYNVTVTGGTASVGAGTEITKAAEGTTVTLTANAAPTDMVFDKWEVISGSITLADANSATTTFTMPAGAVSVKATYTTYITVNLAAGEGSGTMEPIIIKNTYGYFSLTAPECTFTAPANKVFDKWQFSKDDSYLKPGDTKTIWSSADGATLTAIWKDAPVTEYDITVTDGKATVGAGTEITKAAEGTTVTLTAGAAPTGKVFDKWEVVSGGITLADANSATTTFTMPASAVSVKATYKNAPHTHTYNQETVKPEALKTPADCTRNAVYFKSCSCGAISTTDAFVAMNTALGHAYGSDWKYDSTNHWHECSRCHDKKDEAAHDYGSDNVCDTCGYYKTVPHTHNLTLVAAKAATCTEGGKEAYYKCEGCGKFYEDVLGTKEITDLASWGNIAKIAHTTKQTVTKATPTANGEIVNYCSVCKKTLSTTVIPNASSIKLKATSLTYNGKVRTPKVIVKDITGKTLVKNTDYTVSYAKGRKYVGKYAVKITFKGKYSGTKTLYFTIKPKATRISSLKAGSKKFTVKWKKQATQTTGYQVQVATNKKFKKNKKTVTIKKQKTTKTTVKKLKAKKKYYVRVRTYKTVKINGKSIRIYSGWSKAKTVTTKK